jgi:YggT family protein
VRVALSLGGFVTTCLKANKRYLMQSVVDILSIVLGVAKMFIFAHFILSWLISFQVLNLRQPLVAQIWFGLQRLLDPLYSRIRQYLPNMGGLDLAPLVALFAIIAIEIVIRNNGF